MEPDTANVTFSKRGQVKLEKNGYLYHFERNKDGKDFWCCAERKSFRCKGRMTTVKSEEVYIITHIIGIHSHAPLAFEKQISDSNVLLKKKAIEAIPPSTIIRDTTALVEPVCRPYLPTKGAQKMKIHRVRASQVKEPETLEEICIPENLRHIDGELFVLSESRHSTGINIILGTKTTLELLSESKCWLVDGTFAVVPTIMRQLFSVHGYIHGTVVPLVYCLMSRKSREAYDDFWMQLLNCACDLNIHLRPDVIVSDFERAIISSASDFFQQAETHGCLFHFGQIIWRKVQDLGMATKYGTVEGFCIEVRMLKSLAFVPPEEVEEYYQALYSNLQYGESKTLARWFHRNYIGTETRRPRYKPSFWTTGASASERYFPRTQNSVEAWHRRLKVVVGQNHAGLYKLIGDLSKETVLAKLAVERLQRGEQPATTKTEKKNERLQVVFNRRAETPKAQYLVNIAHNINIA